MYKQTVMKVFGHQNLLRSEAEAAMRQIMGGELTPAQIACFLTALAMKGESGEEITGFAAIMREHAEKVRYSGSPSDLIDTCGTGGSGLAKINVSTMAAFILAAAGVRVAKHGSRSNTSKSGSMDVLEALGVRIELKAPEVEKLLEQEGIAFMFAPLFHPAMKHVAPVRREIGIRTVFNFLGPLANPAGAKRQVLGVSSANRAPLMIQALKELGSERAVVLNGADGLDELTLTGPTTFWSLEDGKIEVSTFEPESIGIARVSFDQLMGGDPGKNAELFEAILRGDSAQAALLSFTLLNAAVALWVSDQAKDLREGYHLAEELVASGKAWKKFESYRAATRRVA